mmetsp:Transcript_89360/g.154749  ORF Transcript_89360/g.154749 Transcript_89360/m.154749 type:complete len:95 (+) Transcript_89360:203-487(+)
MSIQLKPPSVRLCPTSLVAATEVAACSWQACQELEYVPAANKRQERPSSVFHGFIWDVRGLTKHSQPQQEERPAEASATPCSHCFLPSILSAWP